MGFLYGVRYVQPSFSIENTLSPVIFGDKVVPSTFLQTTSLVLSFPKYTELGIQLTQKGLN